MLTRYDMPLFDDAYAPLLIYYASVRHIVLYAATLMMLILMPLLYAVICRHAMTLPHYAMMPPLFATFIAGLFFALATTLYCCFYLLHAIYAAADGRFLTLFARHIYVAHFILYGLFHAISSFSARFVIVAYLLRFKMPCHCCFFACFHYAFAAAVTPLRLALRYQMVVYAMPPLPR